MNYFYILQSKVDKNYYYGSTDHLTRRFNEHNEGRVRSTRYRKPFDLVYYEAYQTLILARERERQVKSSGSARKVIFQRISLGP